jgi:hypothetical protein
MHVFGILVLAASVTWAGEFVTFASGSQMHIDRHEMVGQGVVRLYCGTGFSELPTTQVRAFEPDGALSSPSAGPESEHTAAVDIVPQPTPSPIDLADAAADKYGLPRKLVRSVMAAESAFQPNAVSPKGAVGLMQLMPATARQLGVDAKDPVQNVDAGARYLRDLLVKYDGGLWHALAAYNAGPEAVDKYNGIPPYAETIRYVDRIDKDLKRGATGATR